VNNVNYKNYVGTMTSPFFGRANAANAPRELQLSLQFFFWPPSGGCLRRSLAYTSSATAALPIKIFFPSRGLPSASTPAQSDRLGEAVERWLESWLLEEQVLWDRS